MNIIEEIKGSIYNKSYYQSVISERNFKSSFKYLSRLILLVSLVAMIVFITKIPSLSNLVKENVAIGVNNYPEDLIITFKDGAASVNKPEPYVMKFPEEWIATQKNAQKKVENLVVINTKDPFSVEAFYKYSTVALITKNELVMIKGNDSLEVTPISKIGDIEITKLFLLEKQSKLIELLPVFYFTMPLGVYLVSFIGIFIGTLFVLLVYACIIWSISRIKKLNLSYKKSYQVAMHIMTVMIILELLLILSGAQYSFLIKMIIFALIAYINLPDSPKAEVVS